jgi:rubredoxin
VFKELIGNGRMTAMVLMECDNCRAQWEWAEKQPDDRCPECAGTAVHRKVSDPAVTRMRGLLGTQKPTPEQLKTAFAACTTGGEAFADAVLARAVELGYIELIDGTVWRADPKTR